MRRLWLSAVATVLGLIGAGTAKADIIIDDFDVPTPAVIYQISQLNGNPWTPGPWVTGSGLQRQLTVAVVTPLEFNSVGGSVGNGSFSVDTNNSAQAYATLAYTGFTGSQSNFAASGSDRVQIDFININPGNISGGGVAPDMPITVDLITGSGTLTQTVNIGGSGSPIAVVLPFAGFSGTGDMTNVTGLTITLNNAGAAGRIASDFVIDNVSVPVVQAVPAPPAAALLLAAFPAIAFRRWMAKKPA